MRDMQGTRDVIREADAGSLYGLFRARLRRTPDSVAYRAYDRRSAQWRDFRWSDMGSLVARWQEALSREGLRPGDRVALALRNGPEWIAFDQAALGLGLVVVPLYIDDRPENTGYILREVEASLLVVQDGLRWRRIEQPCGSLPMLRRIVLLDGESNSFDDERLVVAHEWLPTGEFALREASLDPNALATVVYTSGTAGRAKGVMLSHHNILAVMEAGLEVVRSVPGDVFLSFLPLSHMFERTVGYYLAMSAGATVAFSRSISQLAEDLQQMRPTILCAVPRIFERVYGRVME
jgi:long-chain acyl-CoA synthetase